MGKYRPHPFNIYLSRHFNYKSTEEEEIRTQIYSNKETNDFINMVTILKSVWFKTKAEVKPLVIDGSIFLEVTINYFERVTPEEVKQLIKDLRKQVTKNNILVTAAAIQEEKFNNIRVMEL